MAFKFRQLQYFVAVAEMGSISGAARQLSVAQSAVTEAVQELESDLGATLLDRSGRGVALTHRGQQFLRHAGRILAAVADARRSFTDDAATAGELQLGASSLVGLRFFAVLAMSAAAVLTGLAARSLGGRRFAQVAAALAVLVAPIVIAQGSVFQYVSFDYLWWTAIAFCFVKLLQTDDSRWWLGIVGALSKEREPRPTSTIPRKTGRSWSAHPKVSHGGPTGSVRTCAGWLMRSLKTARCRFRGFTRATRSRTCRTVTGRRSWNVPPTKRWPCGCSRWTGSSVA